MHVCTISALVIYCMCGALLHLSAFAHTSIEAAQFIVQFSVAPGIVQMHGSQPSVVTEIAVFPRRRRRVLRVHTMIVCTSAKMNPLRYTCGGAAITCGCTARKALFALLSQPMVIWTSIFSQAADRVVRHTAVSRSHVARLSCEAPILRTCDADHF